jgi:hypothetical protein
MAPSSRVAVLFASHSASASGVHHSGRVYTASLPFTAIIVSVTAILEHAQLRHLPVGRREARRAPSRRRRAATLLDRGSAVALRQRPTIALGALVERAMLTGDRLVTASDVAGHSWWLPATAVWSDAECPDGPEHPRPIGLATASTRDAALLKGISDRLGWEAVLEFERGGDLPAAPTFDGTPIGQAIVLDGRLGHAVPVVVVLGADTMRWGAGSTWEAAWCRALYGDDPAADPSSELSKVAELLAAADLAVAGVDLGTPRLSAAGVSRWSAQLVAHNGSVRSWDAPGVD